LNSAVWIVGAEIFLLKIKAKFLEVNKVFELKNTLKVKNLESGNFLNRKNLEYYRPGRERRRGNITTLKWLILSPAREYYHSVPAFLGPGGNIPTIFTLQNLSIPNFNCKKSKTSKTNLCQCACKQNVSVLHEIW
jgi:hypothetical protein